MTFSAVTWAFTHSHARNWHPLTTLSHMLDCQLFGLNARGHHFTSVLLHTVAVVLLFLVLRQMTGALWRSAFVAALFAIHPLRVESVAWVAERKDVLSAVFFMLTLGAYMRYVRTPSRARYGLVMLLFAFGLMSKPMLVTLPFVLLLLDYWPLGRFVPPDSGSSKQNASDWWKRLTTLPVLEKIPLLGLSAAASAITFLVQKHGGALADPLPLMWRVSNALVACSTYIGQMVWPVGLAPFYPHPVNRLAVWQIVGATILLFVVTALAVILRKTRPYLMTGWFWYLGMLVPVLGIVQVGAQGWADRYTYLPQIGLYLCLAWAAADLLGRRRYGRRLLAATVAAALGLLGVTAWAQAAHWRDNESLWTHTLAVTSRNDVAENNLGDVLFKRGEIDAALSRYEKALAIRTQNPRSGHDLLLAITHNNLGGALRSKGRLDDAMAHYQKAAEHQPDYAEAYINQGRVLIEKRQIDEAIAVLERAGQIQPDNGEAHISLGDAFLQKRAESEAISHYEAALQLAPDSLVALNNLAWLYATSTNPAVRNGPRAVALAEQAVQLSGGKNPFYLQKLAAAYAEGRNFPEAIKTAERALQIASNQGNAVLISEIRRNLALYRTDTPLRY